MNDVLLRFGDFAVTPFHLLVVLGGFALLCLLGALTALASGRRARIEAAIRAEVPGTLPVLLLPPGATPADAARALAEP